VAGEVETRTYRPSAWAAQDLQDNVRLFASVLEDEESSTNKSVSQLGEPCGLDQASGHSVLFDVDATQLPSRFPGIL
jgi:hypothetical protein